MNFDSQKTRAVLDAGGKSYDYYSLVEAERLGLGGISRLPVTLKIVLENLLRRHATGNADESDLFAVADWLKTRSSDREIGFLPARVMMVDSSGIPLMGDMAAMRDAMVRLGGDPQRINPLIPVDFIIDHSVMADHTATNDAIERNMALEFERNRERYEFLRWGAQAYSNLHLIPPGSGICHQINLEYLAQVVCSQPGNDGRLLAIPDSVLGMDSHTPMINSLGIVGWGVGGLEGGTAALGEPVSMLVPPVTGCRLTGKLQPGVTTTDLALTITQKLRGHQLIGQFVEYFGSGVDRLALPERATISNMTPEYGATMGYFAIDAETLRFLRLTGRTPEHVARVEAYAKVQGLWRDADTPTPDYSRIIDIDLASVEPVIAGPRRPHERTPLSAVPSAFDTVHPGSRNTVPVRDRNHGIRSGDVLIAAITSCTNTANPSVMVTAGLLARNAVAHGLKTQPWVKTSLSPGSRVVADYLEHNGLLAPLAELGFAITGFGCMTCMGNSGPLAEPLAEAIETHDIAAVAVLSGNRNFEGRIHPSVKANFLAAPPLVVAYALAGTITKDLTREPLGTGHDGKPVWLHELWPDDAEVRAIIDATLKPALYEARYTDIEAGPPAWQAIVGAVGSTFRWNKNSTFIRPPPFFENLQAAPPPVADVRGARILAMFGDMLTTDHISPIGAITPGTVAGRYLQSLGIKPRDFVNFAARRLNHDVMTRGTFGNIRIRNEMTPEHEGGYTRLMPAGSVTSIYEAAEAYRQSGIPLVVVAGAEYGAGSSRDWAAKGALLLGVRAVLAESFERIHRSNLIGMGVLPLQFVDGANRKTLALDGSEIIDIDGLTDNLVTRGRVSVTIRKNGKNIKKINALIRLDTAQEVEYYRHGGILHYVLRKRLTA